MTEELWTNFNMMFNKEVLEELNIHKDQDINVAICRIAGYVDKLQGQLDEARKQPIICGYASLPFPIYQVL
jgi:hypothetical protein